MPAAMPSHELVEFFGGHLGTLDRMLQFNVSITAFAAEKAAKQARALRQHVDRGASNRARRAGRPLCQGWDPASNRSLSSEAVEAVASDCRLRTRRAGPPPEAPVTIPFCPGNHRPRYFRL